MWQLKFTIYLFRSVYTLYQVHWLHYFSNKTSKRKLHFKINCLSNEHSAVHAVVKERVNQNICTMKQTKILNTMNM